MRLSAATSAPAVNIPADVRWMNTASLALLGAFGVLLATAGLGWLLRHPSLVLAGISVSGDVTHNNAITLRANVAPRLNGNFFTIDLAQARAAFEAVPWVRRAVVRRDFPNRLRVELEEHRAVALWDADGNPRLVNSFGEVFDANLGDVEQDALPRLNGPDVATSAQVLALYQHLVPAFERLDLRIDELYQTAGGSWRLTLDSGAAIELGRGTEDELRTRAERFVQTITQVAGHHGRRVDAVESADLRHTGGYAVRLRGVSTVAVAEPGRKPAKR